MPLQNKILIVIFSLIAPALLIPVESVLPYPVIVEEFIKSLILGYCIVIEDMQSKERIVWAGIVGALFAVSENILYLSLQLSNGTANLWWERFVLTMPMHVLAAVVFIMIVRNKRLLIPVGYIAAAAIHYAFNLIIV